MGCSIENTAIKSKCCKECKEAFSKSPVGMGPEGARCGYFMSGNPVSASCQKYFEKTSFVVSQCQ